MAKVHNLNGDYHLRGDGFDETLCGEVIHTKLVESNMLTCKRCADIALQAIESTTKKERREWRSL